ncbi:hypothetical protein MUTS10_40840 [Escherichia coli]|nr:hypothetical protein MUTS9_27670 [Escherichia coli]BDY80752.1 hypothetical protein MUTS10_40840 [Escherichia coli]BDY85776.1 hypothetical protein MUTS11_40920 [Escherichia coli]
MADDVNNEPYGCAEELCVVSVNGPKIKRWLRAFPSVLNETGIVLRSSVSTGNLGEPDG